MVSRADLDAALARVAPRRGVFGARLVYLAETPSTHDVAGRLAAEGAAEGTVVVADTQTRGRGRFGRSWYSPPGAGLYCSIVFRPCDGPPSETAGVEGARLITLMAGVATAEAVRRATGLPVELKWPNDLIIGRLRRKLGGLLAEGSVVGGHIEFVILGIGLNVRAVAYPPELGDRASSLEAELGRPVDGVGLLAEMLATIAEEYADLRRGRLRAVLDRWRTLAPSAEGGEVEWESPRGIVRGTAAGLDNDGALLVRTSEGCARVVAGEVRWL
jgi:BirA family biotin operon repressor/biotin-[acetyl-CoA-carboxylase] ligase